MNGQPDLLPSSLLKRVVTHKHATMEGGIEWIPCFCASCGKKEGRIIANDASVFALCNACAEQYGHPAGLSITPEEVYYAKVAEAQMEKYGRQLTAFEQAVQLTDPNSFLSKIAAQQKQLTPQSL